VICICAALRPEKRHQDLIDAFAILQRDLPNARLLILGDGPERGSVEQRIAARGLTDRVRILGFHQDVRPYLEIADLCVLSSATEAFSMAILEAMSMGKAIVGPRVGGVTEQVIDGVNGLTYPPGDVAELAAAMQSILQEGRAAAMGVCSRARVEELFTLDRMVESYDALLAAL
jgi:glycosyltransferase involved in cell wall biosynthesis